MKDVRFTGSFMATAEDGTERVLNIFTTIIDVGTLADPHAELEGLKQLQTSEGEPVNRLERGKYEIVATGEILVSDDPKAP